MSDSNDVSLARSSADQAPSDEWTPWLAGAGLVLAVILPFVIKNFLLFQMTLAVIYAIAILGLNLLTGFNGQFSLGHSAFYAIGAYTAAILMDRTGMAYYWTLPIAGVICLMSLSVRYAGAAARRHLSGTGDVRARSCNAADPQVEPA